MKIPRRHRQAFHLESGHEYAELGKTMAVLAALAGITNCIANNLNQPSPAWTQRIRALELARMPAKSYRTIRERSLATAGMPAMSRPTTFGPCSMHIGRRIAACGVRGDTNLVGGAVLILQGVGNRPNADIDASYANTPRLANDTYWTMEPQRLPEQGHRIDACFKHGGYKPVEWSRHTRQSIVVPNLDARNFRWREATQGSAQVMEIEPQRVMNIATGANAPELVRKEPSETTV